MQTYSIYTEREKKVTPSRKMVKLDAYVIGEKAPNVLILPGGGYTFVSNENEGRPMAEFCNQKGLNAYVLYYRVQMGARFPGPLEDVARAMQFIESHAASWQIDPTKIALMGASAGGHLAALFAALHTQFDRPYQGVTYGVKPTALVLSYPVITMGKYTHKVTRRRLLGLFSGRPEQDAASVEKLVTADFPPTFLWHNADDTCVPCENSKLLKAALDKVGVRCDFHLYETGGHGIGLAKGKAAEGWIEDAYAFLQSNFE